jgi:hypothetical protein
MSHWSGQNSQNLWGQSDQWGQSALWALSDQSGQQQLKQHL